MTVDISDTHISSIYRVLRDVAGFSEMASNRLSDSAMCEYWKRQIPPKALLPSVKLYGVRVESGGTRLLRNVDLHLFDYKF